jgi:hypothetical protein
VSVVVVLNMAPHKDSENKSTANEELVMFYIYLPFFSMLPA